MSCFAAESVDQPHQAGPCILPARELSFSNRTGIPFAEVSLLTEHNTAAIYIRSMDVITALFCRRGQDAAW